MTLRLLNLKPSALRESTTTVYSLWFSVWCFDQSLWKKNGLKWFTFNKQIRVIPAEPDSGEGWAIGASNIIGSVEGYYRRTRKALKTTTTPTSIGVASEDTQTTESSGSVDFAAMASASSSGGSGGKDQK